MTRKIVLFLCVSCMFLITCNRSSNNDITFSINGSWCFIDDGKTYIELVISDTSIIKRDGMPVNIVTKLSNSRNLQTINLFDNEFNIESVICDTLIISNDSTRYYLYRFVDNAKESISEIAFYFRKYTFLVHHGVISVDSAWYELEKISKDFFGLDY